MIYSSIFLASKNEALFLACNIDSRYYNDRKLSSCHSNLSDYEILFENSIILLVQL